MFSVPPPGAIGGMSTTNASSIEQSHQLPILAPTRYTFLPPYGDNNWSQMNSATTSTSVRGPIPLHQRQFPAVTRNTTNQSLTIPVSTPYSASARSDSTIL